MTMVLLRRALPLDPDEIKIRFHPDEILNSNFMGHVGQVGQAHLLLLPCTGVLHTLRLTIYSIIRGRYP